MTDKNSSIEDYKTVLDMKPQALAFDWVSLPDRP